MKNKIKELIERYEEYQKEQLDLSKKASGFKEGLHSRLC